MNKLVTVEKDACHERQVPSLWRATFEKIVAALRAGNFLLAGIANVRPLSAEEASRISRNLTSFGSNLRDLPVLTWQTSVCRWMDGYWYVLVDLFVVDGESDLVLFSKVYEKGDSYEFEVESVHVP